jgi:DeoR/GlpR family transcriptional regulator of sugar metabolism
MERTYGILDLLRRKKQVSIREICDTLYCSEATARRDCKKLETMQLAKRVRGGIVLVEGPSVDFSAAYRNVTNTDKKDYICSIAADFVGSGMSLFLDASSTSLRLCNYLGGYQGLTVATNGIDAALMLNNNMSIESFVPGGLMKKGTHTILGGSATSFIDGLTADIAFISCRGINRFGAYDADPLQKEIKVAMMRNAKKTLLLCDSSKFGQTFFHKLCEWRKIEAVITDVRPADDFIDALTSEGCEVLY